MNDRTQFELVSHWHLQAPVDAVWHAIVKAQDWPRWWPYVRAVHERRAGDADGLGSIRHFEWGSRLPYGLAFDVEVVELVKPQRLRGIARGQLDGEGLWELSHDDTGTRVRYTWRVNLTRPWMRVVAPLAAPMFRWNHDGVMRAGEAGLARHLGCPVAQGCV